MTSPRRNVFYAVALYIFSITGVLSAILLLESWNPILRLFILILFFVLWLVAIFSILWYGYKFAKINRQSKRNVIYGLLLVFLSGQSTLWLSPLMQFGETIWSWLVGAVLFFYIILFLVGMFSLGWYGYKWGQISKYKLLIYLLLILSFSPIIWIGFFVSYINSLSKSYETP